MDVEGGNVKKWVTGNVFYIGEGEPHKVTSELVEEQGTLYAFAPVGKLDISYERPAEEAEKILRAALPEVMEKIDKVFEESENETDAVMKLGGVTIPKTVDVPKEIFMTLIAFVRNKLQFDQQVPYLSVVQGTYIDVTNPVDENMDNLAYHPNAPAMSIMTPIGLVLAPHYKMRDGKMTASDELHWYVDCLAAPIQYGDPLQKLQLPTRNIRSFSSIRRTVYQS